MKRSFSICLILVCLSFGIARGNGIVLSNITSVNGAGFVQLQFDLSWENSWRSTTNYDAAWVFFKFKDNDGKWKHLNLTNANNVSIAGYTITVPSDLSGAMIFRNSTGLGNVSLLGMKVGISNLPGSFDIKGFAIEMVQLPTAVSFYVGDGAGLTYTYQNGTSGLPFLVNSATPVIGNATGQLNGGESLLGALATGFPVGFGNSSFLYMMKHEVSQGAYRDFLNTLTYTQQVSRTAIAPNAGVGQQALSTFAAIYRNGIEIATNGTNSTIPAVYGCDLNANNIYNEATDGEWIAGNYLSYMDLAAFLDWAALRPMTELEFEKSCRGPLVAVNGEFASGTNAVASATYPISNPGAANETVTSYSGSVFNTNITSSETSPNGNSPLRVGIHATAFATRISAGAGYYGCLDLSGNVLEFMVTTFNSAGKSFTGVNGDGNLTTAGDANEDFWPGINNNTASGTANTAFAGGLGVTGAAGIMKRGGYCQSAAVTSATVSERPLSTLGTSTRALYTGGRGVKSF